MSSLRAERGTTEPPVLLPFQQQPSVTSTSAAPSKRYNRRHYRSKSFDHVASMGDFFAPGPPPPAPPSPSPEPAPPSHHLPPLPPLPGRPTARAKATKASKATKAKAAARVRAQASAEAGKASQSHARKTPPGHIKRPPNAFILFRSHCCGPRAAGVPGAPHPKSHPGDVLPPPPPTTAQLVELGVTDHRHISRITSHLWRSLPAHEKAYWDALAETRKQEHAAAHPDYKYKPVYRDKEIVRRRKLGKLGGGGTMEEGACEEVARAILELEDEEYVEEKNAKPKGKLTGKGSRGGPTTTGAANLKETVSAVAALAAKKKAAKKEPKVVAPPVKEKRKYRTKKAIAAEEARMAKDGGGDAWVDEDEPMAMYDPTPAAPVRRGGRNKTAAKRSYAGMAEDDDDDDDDEEMMRESAVMALTSTATNGRYSLVDAPSAGFARPPPGPPGFVSKSFAPPRSPQRNDFSESHQLPVASGSGTFDPYNQERSSASDASYDPHPSKRARRGTSSGASDALAYPPYPVAVATAPIPTPELSLYTYNNSSLPNRPPQLTALDLEREHAVLKFEHERLKELHRSQALLLRDLQVSGGSSRSPTAPRATPPSSARSNPGRYGPPPPIVLPSPSYLRPTLAAPSPQLISPRTIPHGSDSRRLSAPNSLAVMGMKRRGTLEYQSGGHLMLISPSFGGYEITRAGWTNEGGGGRSVRGSTRASVGGGGKPDDSPLLTAFMFEDGFMQSVMRSSQESAARSLRSRGGEEVKAELELEDVDMDAEGETDYGVHGEPYPEAPVAEGDEAGKGQYVFLNRSQAENKGLVQEILQSGYGVTFESIDDYSLAV